MPRYPKSRTWPATARKCLRIIAARRMLRTQFAAEIGHSPSALHHNLSGASQPHPDLERKIEEWCEKNK